MGFSFSPLACIALAAVGLFFLVFGIWSVYTYFHRGSLSQQPVLPQTSCKTDPALRKSLLACPTLDITNPRDCTPSLILTESRYSTENLIRPRSSAPSSRRHSMRPQDSSTSLAELR